MKIKRANVCKIGCAPGDALLFLQRWHSGRYVGLGPSPESIRSNGARQLHEQVWLFTTDKENWRIIMTALSETILFLILLDAAQVIRILHR